MAGSVSKSPLPELAERVQSGIHDAGSGRLLSGSASCRRLLDALPSAVLLVDADGQILHANTQATRLLEWSLWDLEGKNVGEIIAPLEELFQEANPATSHRFLSPSGQERYLGCRVALAEQVTMEEDTEEDRPRYLVVFDDETSWTRLLSERDQLLRLAAVGEVLPAVLHELKNPLAAVTALVEVLLEESSEGTMREDLYAILGELRRMRLTMDGVGTMGATLSSNRFQAIDLAMEEACRVLHQTAVAAGISLEHRVDAMPLLALEASVVRAMLFNLIQNAIQASKPGGRVLVRGHLDGPWLEFSVEDSGHGMSREVLARCRDLFFTTKVRGSGVGLSLCNRICSDAGGELIIESEEGKGTKVTARVPARSRITTRPPSRGGAKPGT
jgi:signal transduction histidine kinase